MNIQNTFSLIAPSHLTPHIQVCIYQKALHLSIGSPVPSQANGATKEQPSEHSATTSENPDEAAVHNIDLGGVLNLAAEDTLNIRWGEV